MRNRGVPNLNLGAMTFPGRSSTFMEARMRGLLGHDRMRRSDFTHLTSSLINHCPLTFSGHPAIVSVTLPATRATA